MKKVITFIVLLTSLLPLQAEAEEIISKGEILNLGRCIEVALKMQPDIRAAQNTVSINESRIGQAKANYYPQITWSSSYTRISPASGTPRIFSSSGAGGSFSVGNDDSFDEYSTGFNLSQVIYDFGKTPTQVNIQKSYLDSVKSDLNRLTNQIIFTVKEAYYGVVQSKYNKLVAEDTVQQMQQHLEQAKGFFEAGTRPKFDVTKAEVDLSSAKLNLIRSENAFKIAIATLNNAMGIPDAPEYRLDENLSFELYDITLEDALSKAYENRPDLQSIIAQRKAAERSVALAKTGYYPVLTGNAGYSWSGEQFPLENGWNAGATLSFPLFSGFLTKYQVEEAKATLSILEANEASLRQTIFLEVQQAYLSLRAAEEAIPTATLGVEQARENLEIANGRYAAGVGNPIEVTDAEVGLANARTSYIRSLYDDKVARASLENAMGIR